MTDRRSSHRGVPVYEWRDLPPVPIFPPSERAPYRGGHWRRRDRDDPMAEARRLLGRGGESPTFAEIRIQADEPPVATAVAERGAGTAVVAPPPRTAGELVTDLRPSGGYGGARPVVPAEHYGLGDDWGATWERSAQGWVGKEGPSPHWRPVVTTTERLGSWEAATYLGIVTGEALVEIVDDATVLSEALGRARAVAVNGMVDAGVARGAHAVLGVALSYTSLQWRLLVTATGTAVTLTER